MKNWNVFLKLILFLLLIGLFAWLLFSNSISKYVHPRIQLFIIIALILLVPTIISLFFNRGGSKISSARFVMLAFPLILIMFVEVYNYNPNYNLEEGEIKKATVEDKDFINLCNNSIDSYNKYKMQDITMIGFITEDSVDNRFYISRKLMTCCAADTVIIGIPIIYQANDFSISKWYKIEGELQCIDENIFIKVNKSEIIDKPINEYVYP